MADLLNDTGALRFGMALAGRERPLAGQGALGSALSQPGRVLCTVALEYLDQSDGQFWPFIRVPVVWMPPDALESLLEGISALVRGESAGFSWQPGEHAPMGLQIGSEGAPIGGLQIELGLDLGAFLAEVAGSPRRPGGELALFRFLTTQAAMVRFGDLLRTEREEMQVP
jgi:hypothetical protein